MLARIVLALALASVCAGAASATSDGATPGAYQAVLRAYERHGTVPPCQFSPAQLQSALNGVDSYGAQYFADFTQAIQNAISVRASGSCAASAASAGASRAGAARRLPAGSVGPPAHFGPLTAATGAGVPAPLALMGALAAAAALGGAGVAATRARRRRRQATVI